MYGETRQTSSQIFSWNRFVVEVVREFAKENDIKLTLFSGDWVLMLEKDNKKHFIFGLDFGLNNSSSKLIARDKAAFSELMRFYAILHVEHFLFLRPGSTASNPEGNWKEILNLFKKSNNDIVLKPNAGGGGLEIYRATNIQELERYAQELFVRHRAITIAPTVDIVSEYRVTVLDKEVLHVYEKVKEEDEFRFNLTHGASAKDVKDSSVKDTVSQLAKETSKAIGLVFANIDIVKLKTGEFIVMEANSGVMFEHYAKLGAKEKNHAREIYKKALSKIF